MSSTDWSNNYFFNNASTANYSCEIDGYASNSFTDLWTYELIYCPALGYYITNRDICEKLCRKRNCVNKPKKKVNENATR